MKFDKGLRSKFVKEFALFSLGAVRKVPSEADTLENESKQKTVRATISAIIPCILGVAAFGIMPLLAQTTLDLGAQGRNADFTKFPYTRPVKTGTSLPVSCSAGDVFFKIGAPAGQNLYTCSTPNSWANVGSASSGITQLTGDVTTPSASSGVVTATLSLENSNVGTFGSSTVIPVISVNGKGLITGVTTATINGSGNSAPITAGTLASLPSTCSVGTLYFATDQPAGQQLYTCSSANTWTQVVSLGVSGALAYYNGHLDIVTSIVPLLTSTNVFSGLNSFSNGLQLTTTTANQPTCNASVRGLFWYLNNAASKDGVQVCVFNGSAFVWISLY